MKCAITSLAAALFLSGASAFTVPQSTIISRRPCSPLTTQQPTTKINDVDVCATSSSRNNIISPLFMGRAAAVRAATKGKTDAKKAKINGYYGKKIIMAVKQGGSADPSANRQLGELIKAAKANSVPSDVSF